MVDYNAAELSSLHALSIPPDGSDSKQIDAKAGRAVGWFGPVAIRYVFAVIFCFLLAFVWEAIAIRSASPLVPHLSEVGVSFWNIVRSGDAVTQTSITLERILLGFLLAFSVACVVGFASARNRFVSAFVEPGLLLGLTVPGLVWALLCVIWFGVALATPVITVALCIVPTLIVSIEQGVRSVDPGLLEMAEVYRFSLLRRLRFIWLPALAPFWMSGTRIALSHAWKVIVLVELFGLSDGIGYQLNAAFSAQSVADMLGWTLVLWIVIVLIEYLILQVLERHITRWQRKGVL